jgi:hypothetical protein
VGSPACRGGNGRVAVGEHAEDHVEHPAAVSEFGIELDAADQRPEEAFDDRVGEACFTERRPGRGVVALEQAYGMHTTESTTQQRDPGLVEQ